MTVKKSFFFFFQKKVSQYAVKNELFKLPDTGAYMYINQYSFESEKMEREIKRITNQYKFGILYSIHRKHEIASSDGKGSSRGDDSRVAEKQNNDVSQRPIGTPQHSVKGGRPEKLSNK